MKFVSLRNQSNSLYFIIWTCEYLNQFLQFVIAALIAVAAASDPAYPTPAYPSPAYPAGYKASYSPITITAQSDVRNLDGSGAWR